MSLIRQQRITDFEQTVGLMSTFSLFHFLSNPSLIQAYKLMFCRGGIARDHKNANMWFFFVRLF